MLDGAEITRLAVAIMVLPAVVVLTRRMRPLAGLSFLIAAVAVIFFTYFATLIEEFFFESFFDTLQHLAYGVSGVLALIGAVLMRREVRAEAERME